MQEDIPDPEVVSRLVDAPRMYEAEKQLIWQEVFAFPNCQGESLVWRRYAPTEQNVHRIGCDREARIRERRPEMRYVGFISTTAGNIRGIRTKRGHGFRVEYNDSEGIHHAEVAYLPAAGTLLVDLKKTDKIELKFVQRR